MKIILMFSFGYALITCHIKNILSYKITNVYLYIFLFV